MLGRRHPLSLPSFRNVRVVRNVVAVVTLLLGAYCLIAAATALYAQTDPGHPNPAELAARERYRWPGWIPIMFLALVALYALAFGARRRGRRRQNPPSVQGPPAEPRLERDRHRHRHRDTPSR